METQEPQRLGKAVISAGASRIEANILASYNPMPIPKLVARSELLVRLLSLHAFSRASSAKPILSSDTERVIPPLLFRRMAISATGASLYLEALSIQLVKTLYNARLSARSATRSSSSSSVNSKRISCLVSVASNIGRVGKVRPAGWTFSSSMVHFQIPYSKIQQLFDHPLRLHAAVVNEARIGVAALYRHCRVGRPIKPRRTPMAFNGVRKS